MAQSAGKIKFISTPKATRSSGSSLTLPLTTHVEDDSAKNPTRMVQGSSPIEDSGRIQNLEDKLAALSNQIARLSTVSTVKAGATDMETTPSMEGSGAESLPPGTVPTPGPPTPPESQTTNAARTVNHGRPGHGSNKTLRNRANSIRRQLKSLQPNTRPWEKQCFALAKVARRRGVNVAVCCGGLDEETVGHIRQTMESKGIPWVARSEEDAGIDWSLLNSDQPFPVPPSALPW
jgi:hypothetical protein